MFAGSTQPERHICQAKAVSACCTHLFAADPAERSFQGLPRRRERRGRLAKGRAGSGLPLLPASNASPCQAVGRADGRRHAVLVGLGTYQHRTLPAALPHCCSCLLLYLQNINQLIKDGLGRNGAAPATGPMATVGKWTSLVSMQLRRLTSRHEPTVCCLHCDLPDTHRF